MRCLSRGACQSMRKWPGPMTGPSAAVVSFHTNPCTAPGLPLPLLLRCACPAASLQHGGLLLPLGKVALASTVRSTCTLHPSDQDNRSCTFVCASVRLSRETSSLTSTPHPLQPTMSSLCLVGHGHGAFERQTPMSVGSRRRHQQHPSFNDAAPLHHRARRCEASRD